MFATLHRTKGGAPQLGARGPGGVGPFGPYGALEDAEPDGDDLDNERPGGGMLARLMGWPVPRTTQSDEPDLDGQDDEPYPDTGPPTRVKPADVRTSYGFAGSRPSRV